MMLMHVHKKKSFRPVKKEAPAYIIPPIICFNELAEAYERI